MSNSMERLLRAAAFKPVHRRLAQYVSWMRGATGRSWQQRFFSYPLDDRPTAAAVRNEKLNPIPAAMTSAWAGTLPGVMAGERPSRGSPQVGLVREAE